MWLKLRLEELNLTYADLVARLHPVVRTEDTIKNWVRAGHVRWRLAELDNWQALARALDWTMLDILEARGYELPLENSPVLQGLIHRYEQLPPDKQAVVLNFWIAAIEMAEGFSEDDEF